METERKASEVPTENVDEDIPEPTGRRPSATSAPMAGPATGLGGTGFESLPADEEMGDGERALDKERKATRARPGP